MWHALPQGMCGGGKLGKVRMWFISGFGRGLEDIRLSYKGGIQAKRTNYAKDKKNEKEKERKECSSQKSPSFWRLNIKTSIKTPHIYFCVSHIFNIQEINYYWVACCKYCTFLWVQCSPKIHKNFMLGSKSHEFTVVHILVHNLLFLLLRKKGNIFITRELAIARIESATKKNRTQFLSYQSLDFSLQENPYCAVVCSLHRTVRTAPTLIVKKSPHPHIFRTV